MKAIWDDMQIADYEDAVLAAVFSAEQDKCLPALAEGLPAERFGPQDKRLVYQTALDAWGDPTVKRVTPLVIADRLGANLRDAGGQDGLNYLAMSWDRLGVSDASGLKTWVSVVNKAGVLRGVAKITRGAFEELQMLESAIDKVEDVDTYLADLTGQLTALGFMPHSGAGFRHISEAVIKWSQITADRMVGQLPDRVPTYFPTWDAATVGFPRGEVTLLCGLPSTGKTALAWQVAENLGRRINSAGGGACIGIAELEMASQKLVDRAVCAGTGTDSRHLFAGKLEPEQHERILDFAKNLAGLPIFIDESSQQSIPGLRHRVAALHAKGNLLLLIADYVDLFKEGSGENKEERVSGLYTGCKAIAKDFNIGFLLLAQYTKGVYQRADRLGTDLDIRYTGMAWAVAGAIYHIYNPWQLRLNGHPVQPPEDMGIREKKAWIVCSKNKDAPTGKWELGWLPHFTRWSDPKAAGDVYDIRAVLGKERRTDF